MWPLKSLLIFTLLYPILSLAQTPSTTVVANGKVSYFYEEYRPAKFDLGSLSLCFGGNPKSDTGSVATDVASSSENSGELNVRSKVATTGFADYLSAQKVQWNSLFNKEEYVFHVKFFKQVNTGFNISKKGICNTTNWSFKIEEAAASIKTFVEIEVPANTWILSIKPTLNKAVPSIKYLVSEVATIDQSDFSPQFKANEAISAGEYYYYFVKPGNRIKLELNFDGGDSSSYDILANFEITFVGFNRCEKSIKDFKQLIGSADDQTFNANVVTQAFQKIADNVNSKNEHATEDLHKAMAFLGCMTSQNAASPLMYENKVGSMIKILDGIDSFRESVRKSLNIGSNLNAMLLLVYMSRYSLAANTLNGLKPLCEDYTFLDIKDEKQVMTGYLYMRSQLDTISYFMGIGGSPDLFLEKQYDDIVKKILAMTENVNIKTYVATHKTELNTLYHEFLKIDASRMNQAFERFNSLPKIRVTREMYELSEAIISAHQNEASMFYRLNTFFQLLRWPEDKVMDFTLMKKDLADLKDSMQKIYYNFPKVYELVEGSLAKKFVDDVDNVDMNHRAPTEKWLSSSYGGFLIDFMNTYKPKKGYLTAEELKKCMTDPNF